MLLQIGIVFLLQIGASVFTNWGSLIITNQGSYHKLGQPLLQIRAAITNWGITDSIFILKFNQRKFSICCISFVLRNFCVII